MSVLETLFRLEFVLAESVKLPPNSWPKLRTKTVIGRLIRNVSIEDLAQTPELYESYLKCVAEFDPKKPYSSLKVLADRGDYTICYARDYLSFRFPRKAPKFSKLHDVIWTNEIEKNEEWQAEAESAEFTSMFGHDEDISNFAEVAEASELVDDADFPWRHLNLSPE